MQHTHGLLWRIMMKLMILILIGLIAWIALVGMVYWKETHLPPAEDFDALIVLGCQVRSDGSLSVQLQLRLEKAYDTWKEKGCQIVVCGGQGSDEPQAEAVVMKEWLIAHGVPEEYILCDAGSSNTRENLRNAMSLLGGANELKVAIVTSDYHVARAIALAEDAGLNAVGIGSETLGGMFWIKNHFREALSWVKYWGEKYILRRTV